MLQKPIRDTGIPRAVVIHALRVKNSPYEEVLTAYPQLDVVDITMALGWAIETWIEALLEWRNESLTRLLSIRAASEILLSHEVSEEERRLFLESNLQYAREGIDLWNDFMDWALKTYRPPVTSSLDTESHNTLKE
jgi:uncharacterized protein (DUF433 family)